MINVDNVLRNPAIQKHLNKDTGQGRKPKATQAGLDEMSNFILNGFGNLSAKKVTDQKVTDQKVTDQKVADQKVTDQKVTDQKVADQKVADQKVTDQKVRLVEGDIFNKLLNKHGFRVLNKLTGQESLLLEEIIRLTTDDNEWVTLSRNDLEKIGVHSNKLATIRNKLAGLKDDRFKYQLIEFESFRNEKNKEQTRYRVKV